MGPFLRVSIAQINTTVGDFDGNRRMIVQALRKAQKQGSHLVTFPELALTGYPPEDILFKSHFVADNLKSLRSLLPETRGLAAVIGFVDRDREGRLYNAAAFCLDRKLAAVYHKVRLPNYGVFDEKRYFAEGDKGLVVDLGGARVGVTICEDIWQSDAYMYHRKYAGHASVLVNISASPYHAGKQSDRLRLLQRLAKRSRACVVYTNLVGGQDELVFDGSSMVIDPSGRVRTRARRFEEDFLSVDIPMRRSRESRAGFDKIRVVRPARKLILPSGVLPLTTAVRPAVRKGAEEVYAALLTGTRDYVRKNHFEKVIIGLSGGIDSSLVARIAVDALGARNVIGVTMPSPYTSSQTYRDAKLLARNLGISIREFRIETLFRDYRRLLARAIGRGKTGVTEQNIQARIRGTILMALSNRFGYLVLTTGNKSETATGYCTLYGDMAGGFAVLKDVPKTLVYELSRYRNALDLKNSIPPSVLKRAPSAELRPHQKDQDTLPPYAVLDRFLELYVEKDLSVEKIIGRGFPKALARKVATMVDRNEYKRRQAPPGIKITPKAFGRDRRMPITHLYTP